MKTIDYNVPCRLNCEYTYTYLQALCPVDGQTDFYTLHISIIPNTKIFDIYNLKNELKSFTNVQISQEDLTYAIFRCIYESVEPEKLQVKVSANIAGGIHSETIICEDDYHCQ